MVVVVVRLAGNRGHRDTLAIDQLHYSPCLKGELECREDDVVRIQTNSQAQRTTKLGSHELARKVGLKNSFSTYAG